MNIEPADLLRTYSFPSLQQMARQHGVEFQRRNKERLVESLAPIVVRPTAIQKSLDDLTPEERLLLDRLILASGNMLTALMRRHLEREGAIEQETKPDRTSPHYYSTYGRPEKGSSRNRGSRKFEDVVARLGALGLAFTAEPVQSGGTTVEITTPGRRLLIPDAILRLLPKPEFTPLSAITPAEVRPADRAILLRDLYLLLSFAANEPIPLSARGLILKRALVRIDAALRRSDGTESIRSEDELRWLPFLRALGGASGLLIESAGDIVLDPRAESFLRLSAAERQQRLYEGWRTTTRWNELFRIPLLTTRGKGMSLRVAAPGIVAARQRLVAELAELPVGEWIALDSLIERMRLRAYEFLLPRRWDLHSYSYSSYYGTRAITIPDPYRDHNAYGLLFDVPGEEKGWPLVEARFIRVVMCEALYALRVVDLDGIDGAETAFRITEDGDRLLRGRTPIDLPSQPHVIVQPNFQIFVMEPTGEDVLFRLDQLADRRRIDLAVEHELTRDSVYRAQRAGLDASAIITFLQSVSSVELPQNVRRTVEEWGAQVERITVRRRTPLLHAVDEKILDDLFADPDLASLLGRRVAPTVALVASANLQPLIDLMARRGLLPALTEGPIDDPVPLLASGEGGQLTSRQRLPSIHDVQPLRELAAEEDGSWRLSQHSLRRGAKDGLTAEDILATLERLHAGPLGPEIQALVRKWAKNWGAGAMFEATVLQVESAETLADLLADRGVRSTLTSVPGSPTIALVRPGAEERVRALLDERGMALSDQPVR